MSDYVREAIAERIRADVGAVAGVTALRPKRVQWTEEVTKDQTVVIRQGPSRTVHEDETDLVCEQDFDLPLLVIDSDAAAASIDTRLNALHGLVVRALAADPALNGNAMYGGLRFNGTTPIEDPAGRLSGEALRITVTYSVLKSDLTQKGVR